MIVTVYKKIKYVYNLVRRSLSEAIISDICSIQPFQTVSELLKFTFYNHAEHFAQMHNCQLYV
jgi:hypothetical protein